jgi:uncharacterized membrane protein YqjE
VAAALGELLFGRLGLLLVELQEGIDSLIGLLLWAFIGLMAAGMGLLIGALALIFAFWDTHRLLVSLLVMGVFFLLAITSAAVVAARLRSRRQLFGTTLEEFAHDREFFRTRP